MILNKQLIDLTLKSEQKAMTPADELMALAGKWITEAEAEGAFDLLDRGHSNGLHACAADLRALLYSDAFRAMARESQRYLHLRDKATRAELEAFADRRGTRLAADRLCDAAIDAAASGSEAM